MKKSDTYILSARNTEDLVKAIELVIMFDDIKYFEIADSS